jgi:hypothetical protein
VSPVASHLPAQTTSVIQGAIVDSHGLAIADAEVTVSSDRGGAIRLTTDQTGSYRFAGLQSGAYNLLVSKPGFSAKLYERLPVTLNRVLTFDIELSVSAVREEVRVSAVAPLLDPTVSSSGSTITNRVIEDMPINGRNYLDLMQLVPGVAVNRHSDPGLDVATPILGERAGNAIFLIDGMPNSNQVDGGPGSPFDQNSILEFQVLTAGYKAQFGRGSGGVVNVVSKSGTGDWHGSITGFHRHSALDSSNVPGKSTPFLRRWDLSTNLGGPILKERAFIFGSLERIRETRELNFSYPRNIPDFLRTYEESFNQRSRTFQTRAFARLDETLGTHRLTQQFSLSNSHVSNFLPLSQAASLPSARTNLDGRHLLLGVRDTATLGDEGNPWLLNAYLQHRGEPYAKRPTHPKAGLGLTRFNMFSRLTTGEVFGDLGQVQFGPAFTPVRLNSNYVATGVHLNKLVGAHDLKAGWDFERTRADGLEASNLSNQLFATVADFAEFGPVNSGLYVLANVSGLTPEENSIRLRNNYNGSFAQDDWKLAKQVTLHLGVRWDYDSRSPNRFNFSPRLGLAWSVTPATVITASWGVFYDRFRLGLARDVPDFGGANLVRNQTVSLPRLFYGVPTAVPYRNLGFCPSPVLTDTQIRAGEFTCPIPTLPLLGVDRLNAVVAPGRAPIPPNTVVNLDTVQNLTGFTPEQFADGASAALGRPPGFFTWGGFGNLTVNIPGSAFNVPITVHPDFKTPYSRAVHVGVQREITTNLVIQAGYHHRDVRNMLGVRTTNLAFEARLPNRAGQLQPGTGARPIHSYGPWYKGKYDGINLEIRKRMSRNLSLAAFYTWANATDNAYRSSFVSDVQTASGATSLASSGPTDSFVGIPPVVSDPATGQSNAGGAFIASNGNPVPQAGRYYNGADLDLGPSDLAVDHTFVVHGTVRLPWMDVSSIVRAQSGFHYSAQARRLVDVDGDGSVNGVDFSAGRNSFQAPGYANIDLRLSRRISISENVRVQAMFEFFNLLNRANPAAVQQLQTDSLTPFGKPLQYLPGREGQVGLRFEF